MQLRYSAFSKPHLVINFTCFPICIFLEQDTKSRNKPPPLKAPIMKLGFDNTLHDLVADEVVVAGATKNLGEMSSEIVVSPSFFSELRQKVSAKKRQISYDVVEIVTIAPERNLTTEVTESIEDETFASGLELVDEADRVDVMTEDVRMYDMGSDEDDRTVPTVETIDACEFKDMELDRQDTPSFEEDIVFLTREKDGIDRPEGDLDDKCYDTVQEEIRNLDDETENSISANSTLTVNMDDDGGLESDQAATIFGNSLDDTHFTKQLLFNDMPSDKTEVISANIVPSEEDTEQVNKETMHHTKLENTKSLKEWSPSDEHPSSWVFPDESRASCTAPSIIHLSNSVGRSNIVANNNAAKVH